MSTSNGIWKQVLGGVLIGLFSMSVGYSIQSLSFSKLASQNMIEISYLKTADSLLRTELDEERRRTDARLTNLIGLINEVVKQNHELITLIKLQNQVKP